ncbi:MAG: tetratricopeptide repeat protein [Planctomycetes bacterium]|nr:tetratricopeptide repeat protein [Planctomycetota bacterium]
MSRLDQLLAAAVKEHQAGRLDCADALYRETLALAPEHPDALHLLGVAAHQRGDHRAAVQSIRDAIRRDPGRPLYHSNLGAALRSLGRIDEAVGAFRRAVELEPEFAGGHYNLAMAHEAAGRSDAAIRHYRRAIAIHPAFAEAHNNLGRLQAELGRAEEALDSFHAALTAQPEFASARYNLGNALEALGRRDEAIAEYRKAIQAAPHVAAIHNNLGCALKDAGDLDGAEASFRQVLRLQSGDIDARLNLGSVYVARGERQRAVDCFRDVITADESRVDAWISLGELALSDGRHDEAREAFTRSAELAPDKATAWSGLGIVHAAADRLDEAAACLERAVALVPADALAHYRLGNVLKDLDRALDAERCYRRALDCDPSLVEARINLGVVAVDRGDLSSALAHYDEALCLRSDSADGRFHRSLALLAAGDYQRGWPEYDSRWDYEGPRRNLPWPRWQGEPLAGRTLLVHAEQGVGDEILFASCLPDALAAAGRCVIECDRRLVPLFERSFHGAEIVPRPLNAGSAALAGVDAQVAAGDLPRVFRPDVDSFPSIAQFLAADPNRVAEWRRRLAELGDAPKIGISWRGGAQKLVRRRRSTTLEQWLPVFSAADASFISVQYGDCREELEALAAAGGARIHRFDDVEPLRDLDEFAALLSGLDLVISVDNSTVHLAGALGVSVWTLLPFSANWRWLRERDDTPWYPSMRLFRQPVSGEWEPVFARIADELTRGRRFGERTPSSILHPPSSTPDPTRPRPASDLQSQRERAKYEQIWTCDDYRTFSPGLVDADKVQLIERLRAHKVERVLDAGCGSGKLMRKLLEEHGGEFRVHGMDISGNCLDPFFDSIREQVLTVGCLWKRDDFPGRFDAVICTDVLEHIPTDRVPEVLANFRGCASKLCYVAIALFPDGFGPKLLGEPLHLTVKEPAWWHERFTEAGFAVEWLHVEQNAAGRNLWLHAMLLPASTHVEQAACLLQPAESIASPESRTSETLVLRSFRRGNELKDAGRLDEAIAAYREAIALDPNHFTAWHNLGSALKSRGDLDEAAACFERILAARPDDLPACVAVGNVRKLQERLDEAATAYGRALRTQRDQPLWKLWTATLCPMIARDNAAIDEYRQLLCEQLEPLAKARLRTTAAELASVGCPPPYNLQFHGRDDRPLKELYARVFESVMPGERTATPPNPPLARGGKDWLPPLLRGGRGGRPRIGFVVTTGHEGVFLRYLGQVIEQLDHERFDLSIVCSESGRARIRRELHAEHVETLVVPARLDRMVEAVRAARFDLLYHWEVGSDATNYFLPFFRLAAVQCTGGGLPVTSGIPAMDYFLSDEFSELPDADAHYSERLIRAKSLLTCQRRKLPPAEAKDRDDFGLPASAPLYVCAQKIQKLHPDFDATIAGILRTDARGTVAITLDRNRYASDQLRERLRQSAGDVFDRIRFLPRLELEDYRSLLHCADVLLDPLHYGGGLTAFDGFSLARPIVTLPSQFLRGRYTAGFYRRMDYGDLVAETTDDYVRIAVALANDRDRLEATRREIAERSEVLFNDRRAAAEYAGIFERLIDEVRRG